MGKKGTKRKTRWRVLPIGGDDVECLYSTNEDDADGDHAAASATTPNGPGSYARAAQPGRGKLGSKARTSSFQSAYYNRPQRSTPDSRQPMVTTEKKTFNEEEYTKITTPRQDVLFKKGYLGRKKTVANATTPSDGTAAAVTGVSLTSNNIELVPMHNGGDCELLQGEQNEAMNSADEQPQYIYTNGYMDGVIYVNGGYEWYDPYSNVTVLVGPPPPFAAPGAAPPVLAAVPCQPLPLQPLEWFNPAYSVPYMASTMHSCPRERDRRKRFSADSQNCSPQSSESTDAPGSPQEGEGEGEGDGEVEGELEGEGEGEGEEGEGDFEGDGEVGDVEVEEDMLPQLPTMMNGTEEYAVYTHAHSMQPHPPPAPQAYMYPGAYMFGQPIYNMNGITVQSTSQLQPNADTSGSKRRKKKRRRRRRRGGVDDGSEETSSEEKDLEDPVSLTSQESSQKVELDSKSSPGSASCSTVIGCPELPETTPESQSSSPSLSPSLSSSPSPSNVTEDKTVLPNINCVDTNIFLEKQNLRSDSSTKNIEAPLKVSEQGIHGNNVELEVIPSEAKVEEFHNNNNNNNNKEANIELLVTEQKDNLCSKLVNEVCETNGKHQTVHTFDETFELDNTCFEVNSLEPPNSESVGKSSLLNDSHIVNNKISLSKQKSKNKKALKLNKQKLHPTLANGILHSEISNCSLKENKNIIEMDGNENKKVDKNTQKGLTEELKGDQSGDENKNIAIPLKSDFNPSESNNLSEDIGTPKKPARTHQHRQQKSSDKNRGHEQTIDICSKSFVNETENASTESNSSVNFNAQSNNQKSISSDQLSPKLPTPPSNSSRKDFEETNKTGATAYIKYDKNLEQEREVSKDEKYDIKEEREVEEVGSNDVQQDKNYTESFHSNNLNNRANITNQFDVTKGQEVSNTTEDLPSESTCCMPKTSERKTEIVSQKGTKDVQKSLLHLSESSDALPPVPPPRRKKWHSSRVTTESQLVPGVELESKKQIEALEDNSSSSSQSEESVIDLHSSPNTKTDHSQNCQADKVLWDSTSLPGKSLNMSENLFTATAVTSNNDMKFDSVSKEVKVYASDLVSSERSITSNNAELCISNQAGQMLKGDQITSSCSKSNQTQPEEPGSSEYGQNIPEAPTDANTKLYAEDLASHLLGTGMSTAVTAINKPLAGQSLSLTEAVTQWLHSQDSEELLQVPHLNESESEVEFCDEEILTGPKNVHRNPLLAPSCKTKIVHDSVGIRVANLQNSNSLYDNCDCSSERKSCNFSDALGNIDHYPQRKLLNENGNCSIIASEIKCTSSPIQESYCCLHQTSCIEKSEHNKYPYDKTLEIDNLRALRIQERDDFIKCYDEYDADWECEQTVLKLPSLTTNAEADGKTSCTMVEEVDNDCSVMCDPTVSVKKYYRLGTLSEKQEKNGKKFISNFDNADTDPDSDIDRNDGFGDGSDGDGVGDGGGGGNNDDEDLDYNEEEEEVDALILFRNELAEQSCASKTYEFIPPRNAAEKKENRVDYMETVSKCKENCVSSCDGSTTDSGIHSEESCNEEGNKIRNERPKSINSVLKRKSAVLLSQLVSEGPFPCGGICCILQ